MVTVNADPYGLPQGATTTSLGEVRVCSVWCVGLHNSYRHFLCLNVAWTSNRGALIEIFQNDMSKAMLAATASSGDGI